MFESRSMPAQSWPACDACSRASGADGVLLESASVRVQTLHSRPVCVCACIRRSGADGFLLESASMVCAPCFCVWMLLTISAKVSQWRKAIGRPQSSGPTASGQRCYISSQLLDELRRGALGGQHDSVSPGSAASQLDTAKRSARAFPLPLACCSRSPA